MSLPRRIDGSIDRDRAHVWHPYTQMQTAPPPLPIVGGKGVYLYTEDGRTDPRRHLVVVGEHPRPLASRAERRARASRPQRLEHVMFAGCTHPPAVDLAERLVSVLPRRADARLLFGQRIDRRRGRGQAGHAVLDQHG